MSQRPRQPGLLIGRVLGVPVRLMPSWFVFAAYLVFTGQSVLARRIPAGQAYLVASTFVLLLLASVLLHELGHLVVARAFGLPVRSVTVTLLAGFTEIVEAPQTPAREYAVAVTGPMVSVLLSGLAVVGAAACADGSLTRLVLEAAAATNGAIGVLNLLPGLPLDGGRVLRSVVWQVAGDAERATRAAARAGIALAVVVLPALVLVVLPALGVGDRTPATYVVAFLVSAFVYSGASATLRRSTALTRLAGVSAGTLARPAVAVPASTPLAEAVRRAQAEGARAVVVTDSAGVPIGVLSEAWVKQVPLDRRPWVTAGEGARTLEDGLRVDPDVSGEELVRLLQATPASEYLVAGDPLRVLVASDVAAVMTAPEAG